MTPTAYIGIGSNIGDRFENCAKAIGAISKIRRTTVAQISKWRPTKAIAKEGAGELPEFVNGAVKVETELTPEELLSELRTVEETMGRPATREKWSPRIIDLDILLYGDTVMNADTVKIPHPELHKRAFVLQPLCDIEPALKHPVVGKTVSELLKELETV